MPADPALPSPAPPPGGQGPLWPLLLLGAALGLPEVVFLGADAGLWGSRIWRQLGWQYGGFWAGLWHGWVPNYPGQPWTMVLSYSLLHAGPAHLLGNLAGLWALGGTLRAGQGTARVLAVWVAGILGGALVFGVLATSPAPMVGASGAVFGLVGAWWWADAVRPGSGPGPSPGLWMRRAARAAGIGLLLVAANVAMYLSSAAGIAWETHLGGFLAGAALVAALPRRPGGPGSDPAAAASGEEQRPEPEPEER
jgi:membrane associated rhomboid family serine protease